MPGYGDRALADWERELLDLLPRSQPAPEPAPKPRVDTSKPITGIEMFRSLPIGTKFFLTGPSTRLEHRFVVRTKVSETHYTMTVEGRPYNKRANPNWNSTTKVLPTL